LTKASLQNNELQERVNSISQLFLTVFLKTVLEHWGADTLTFCESTPVVSNLQLHREADEGGPVSVKASK
jgi:hypothetical protein